MCKKMYMTLKYVFKGSGIVLVAYYFLSNKCKELIQEDINAYTKKGHKKMSLLQLLFEEAKRLFRNVLYYRMQSDNINDRLIRFCKFWVPPLSTIEIAGEIGGGLKIIHNT